MYAQAAASQSHILFRTKLQTSADLAFGLATKGFSPCAAPEQLPESMQLYLLHQTARLQSAPGLLGLCVKRVALHLTCLHDSQLTIRF